MTFYVDPDRAQFEAFKALDRDAELNMLNLVQFRAAAAYGEGHPLATQGLSGADAYLNYGIETGPILAKVGGSIIWRATFETMLIGPHDETWDAMFIARYPTAHAFLAMISDPAYQKAVVHRQAAVKTSRLIRCQGRDLTDHFA
ncbi:MAG: DUF1330 domain-containing protein [Pseudomonadota bacterium]